MKYFKNTSWLFFEKILRMSVGLFISIWVARYLGPEQYGLLSYAQSFVALFTVIATLGLDNIVVRELVEDESKRDRLLGTAFVLKLVGAFLTLGTLGIGMEFTSNDLYTNILVFVIASAVIFQSFNVINFYFQSMVLSRYVVYASTVSLFLSTAVKIGLILYEAPLTAFAAVVLFDNVTLAFGYIYFYQKQNLSPKQWKFDLQMARLLLNDSLPLILSGAVLMVQARIDQVMLKEMVGSQEVGYYSVAMRLIETISFVPMVVKNSLLPAIINAKKQSQDLYEQRLADFYRLFFLLFLVIAIPVFFFSESIVVVLFGEAYRPAGVLLSLFAIRLFFANMGVARSIFMLTENLYRFSLLTMIAGTLVNIGLNYVWIPSYAAIGALYATIVSFSVTTFFIDVFYSKTRGNVLMMLKSMVSFYRIKSIRN